MKIKHVLILIISICTIGLTSCKKDKPSNPLPSLPTIATKPASNIGATSVVSGGEITSTVNITDKGVIWGTDSSILTVSNLSKTSRGPGSGDFTDSISNLQPNTTYYLKAYAKSGTEVGYGATVKFTTLPPQPTVYIAGFHGNPAAYWKNGQLFLLPNGTYAHSVYVVGNDVYVSGYYNNGTAQVAVYWKNGIAIPLTNGASSAIANSIYVVGNDVYVAGYEVVNNDPTLPVAKYWKNGVSVPLTNGTLANNGVAKSIVVVGNDVYVAGFVRNSLMEYSIATYWKNGVAVSLTDSINATGDANSIFVDGNDVYVAGKEKPGRTLAGFYTAKFWKNGTAVSVTDGLRHASANAIYVVGNDVYVAGNDTHTSSGRSIGTYWKNGTAFPLSNPSQFGDAYSIQVVGSDVYVAGGEGDYLQAKCWKNGIPITLEISSNFTRSKSIFVQN